MIFRRAPAAPLPGAFDPSLERSRISETLLRSSARLILGRSEVEIVRGVCQSMVDTTPHLCLAWTWFGPSDTQVIEPQVYAGPASAYASKLRITRNALTQMGPAFSVLDGKPAHAFGVSRLSPFGPWREATREFNIRHVLAMPLPSQFQGYGGIFVLYADRPGYFDEVGLGLFMALSELFGSLMTVASERQELERTAYHDALTGLLNRHAVEVIDRRLYRRTAFDPPSALLMLDLDHFKSINDQHGHDVGDQALQATADVLRRELRREDEVVRWGGEEFLVCLPNTSLADALRVADKLRAGVAEVVHPVALTVSVGACEIPPSTHLEQAVVLADQALLRAKQDGRNRVCAHP